MGSFQINKNKKLNPKKSPSPSKTTQNIFSPQPNNFHPPLAQNP